MRISEKEYKELCKNNKIIHKPKQEKPNALAFDSMAEQNFYFLYIVEKIKSGLIVDCKLHNEFVIVDAIPTYKLRKKVFKPDFKITLSDGRVFIIEMKGKTIKKLQRDYGLRKHLFIEKYCIPNNWIFIELESECWTQQPQIEKTKNLFEV